MADAQVVSTVVGHEQNLVERDLVPDRGLQPVDVDGVSSRDPVLLAAGLDDRVQSGLL